MKAKLTKIAALLIAMAFVVSSLPVLKVSANSTTIEAINPLTGTSEFFFDTNTLGLGDTFMARIIVKNVSQLWQYQILIGYDNNTLNVLEMTYTSDIDDWVFKGLGATTLIDPPTINNTAGFVLGGANLNSLTKNFTGTGTLCMIKFQVMKEPARHGEVGPSTIDIINNGTNTKKPLFYTFVADPDMIEMAYTDVDGIYKFTWAVPSLKPWLEVDPSYKKVGGGAPITITPIKFTVNILIHDVDPKWQLVGVQFRLIYNSTLLWAINVTEGPFMPNPVWAPYGTVFAGSNENNTNPYDPWLGYGQAIFGDIIWPSAGNETWIPPFPEGDGILCTIEFQVMYQKEFPWMDSSNLNIEKLMDLGGHEFEYFFDSDFTDIPAAPEHDGRVDIMGYILGLQIDVYTQYAYLNPDWGGVGPNSPSDAFAPQATVILEAKVTYNLDPVQFKTVNFRIIGPTGKFEFFRTAMTDANGIARIEFGIPWPCADWHDCFGIWDVFASVEVRESVKNDTLQFRVGWLVEIVSVTPEKFEWHKGEHFEFTVVYKTISTQPRSGIMTMVVYDNLIVPIGQLPAISFTVGGAPLLGEKVYPPVNMVCLTIPKWAFIGDAKAYTDAFTQLPHLGGIAYCPEVATDIRIVKV